MTRENADVSIPKPLSGGKKDDTELDIVDELRGRAECYRYEGPSAEHTAILFEKAAMEIESLRSSKDKEKNRCISICNEIIADSCFYNYPIDAIEDIILKINGETHV